MVSPAGVDRLWALTSIPTKGSPQGRYTIKGCRGSRTRPPTEVGTSEQVWWPSNGLHHSPIHLKAISSERRQHINANELGTQEALCHLWRECWSGVGGLLSPVGLPSGQGAGRSVGCASAHPDEGAGRCRQAGVAVFPWATSAAPLWHWPPGGPQPQWLHGVLSPSGSCGVGSNR